MVVYLIYADYNATIHVGLLDGYIHTPDDPPTSIQASSNVEVAAHWTTICTAPAESDTNTNRHTGMDHRTHDELTWEVYDIKCG